MRRISFLLVGTPRSGTTLTQRICCELPGVAMPPETHLLQLLAPDLLGRLRFPLGRREVADELDRFVALPTSRELDLDRELVLELVGQRCESVFQLFSAVVVALCAPQPPGTVYGEKTPEHLLWWRAMAASDPNLRIVGVVRDPRAVAASHRAVPWGIGDVAELAEEWAFDQRQLCAARRRLGPARCLILRYEDLVVDPDDTRARLAGFLGVPVPGRPARPGRSIVGSWEWWKARALQPVTAVRSDAWRFSLSDSDAAAIVEVAGPEMARFGYLVGPQPRRRPRSGARGRGRLAVRLRRMRRLEALAGA